MREFRRIDDGGDSDHTSAATDENDSDGFSVLESVPSATAQKWWYRWWKKCPSGGLSATTRHQEVEKVPGYVQMNPTSLPELF